MPVGPALARLRADTEALHREAERHVRILDPDATDAVYARYLARMYGFHVPMEDAFAGAAALVDAGFEPLARRKRGLLARDLAALGVRTDGLPLCPYAPRLDGPAAIGAAYVIEGSTLGGAFILARLRAHLGHLVGHATAFLAGYGADTGTMWRRFVVLADDALASEPARAEACAGARATFAALITWLDEPAAEPPHPHRGLDRWRGEHHG